MRIGDVSLETPLVLAPMAGVTDRQFRLILRRIGGVGLVTMEFVSANGLDRGDRRIWSLTKFSEEERPISIQIYGSRPGPMVRAARIVEDLGADICDINMGCPANKILRGCAGCGLMGDLDLARRIIRDVRREITIPLTVKFRAGLDDARLHDLELGRICQEEGVDAVALHPRTARQKYHGRADWSRIARLKAALSIPVLGNGDVETPTDAVRMLRETGCDGVMIGRASMLNPWIYLQTAALLNGEEPPVPSLDDRRAMILEHFRLVMEQEEPRVVMHKLRTFTGWYTRGLPGGRSLRVRISSLGAPAAFVDAIEQFFVQARNAA